MSELPNPATEPSPTAGSASNASAALGAASRQYNEALTRLDRAVQVISRWPELTPPDHTQVPRINAAWNILPDGDPTPAGGVRGRLAGFVWRLIGPALQQQLTFNAALVDHLNREVQGRERTHAALSELFDSVRLSLDQLAGFESLLLQFLQRITPLVDAKERALQEAIAELRTVAALAQRASAVTQRHVERLAESPSTAGAAPSAASAHSGSAADAYKYVGFEDRFRGSEAEISARLARYLPLFEGASDVLDIGCGRGELLELLARKGVSARGLDLNPAMVEVCLARGQAVVQADALGYLRGLPDGSLGGLVAIQVVEHLEPDYLVRMLQEAFHKLRPGSPIVLETINPTCWVAFFESYIRDLTHVRPVHPETLQYLVLASGFNRAEIRYSSPVEDRLQTVSAPQDSASHEALTELVAAFNRNVERLNARMFTYLDYAVVAVRP